MHISLSLSLLHTHTHTHTYIYRENVNFLKPGSYLKCSDIRRNVQNVYILPNL